MKLEKYKRFMPLFWPIFIEQVLAVFIGLISTAMVSGAGAGAVAGVGLIGTLNFTVMNAFISVATGTTVVVSHCVGRGDNAGARKVSAQSLSLVVYISIVVAVLMIVFDEAIVGALFGAAEADVLESALSYMFFSSLSMPLLAIYSTINGILRASGDMKTPMQAAMVSILCNIVVAAIAIYGFNLGVVGAGLGVVAFRAAPTIMLLLHIKRGQGLFRGFKPEFKVSMETVKPVLAVAIPAGVDSIIFNGCKVVVQVFMADMGTDVLAAYSILMQLTSLSNLPGGATSILATSVAGQAYGAGDHKEARRSTWQLYIMSIAFLATTGALVLVLMNPLITMFSPTDAVFSLTRGCMISFILISPIIWPASFMLPSALRAMDMARYTMVVSIVSMILLRVFGAWLFGVYLNWTLNGIWVSMYLDWLGRGAFFAGALWLKGRKEIKAPS